jgi:hypothetical protein
MERRPGSPGRLHRLILATTLGVMALGAMPWAVFADESASPTLDTPEEPTSAPTAAPTPDPTPDPTAAPTPAPTPPPAPTAAPQPTNQPADHTPEPTDTPDPTATPTPMATPTSGTVLQSRNLYRSSAMVRQYTNYWCVPATVQSMANLVLGTSNRTYSRQSYIYKLTRQHNRYRYRTKGNDPQGWGWSLRYFTRGRPYYPRAYSNKDAAINSIASTIARTRHPVGVTVYGGTHAWVVLGYRQTYDRSEPSKKTLLGLYVSGPLGTTRDKWPYKYMTVAQFREVFTRYHEWQRRVIWEGKWVVLRE